VYSDLSLDVLEEWIFEIAGYYDAEEENPEDLSVTVKVDSSDNLPDFMQLSGT